MEILPPALRLDKVREGRRHERERGFPIHQQRCTDGTNANFYWRTLWGNVDCRKPEAGPFMIPKKNFLLPNLPDDPAE